MEERVRTRARALAQGVEAQMLALGAGDDIGRAWRDWVYECVVETASEPPMFVSGLTNTDPAPSLDSSLLR